MATLRAVLTAELGNVVYGLGMAIAALTGLLALAEYGIWHLHGPMPGLPLNNPEVVKSVEAVRSADLHAALVFALISLGSWLVGRAARYILAGR